MYNVHKKQSILAKVYNHSPCPSNLSPPHSIVRHLPRSLFLYFRSFADGGDLLLDRPSWCRRLLLRSSSRWEERPNYKETRFDTLSDLIDTSKWSTLLTGLRSPMITKSEREKKKTEKTSQPFYPNMTFISGV
jgi:hypothetical protein